MCLNIKICKGLVSNMSNFHPLQVVCRGSETQLEVGKNLNYCRSGNIREVLFFANFASMSNS